MSTYVLQEAQERLNVINIYFLVAIFAVNCNSEEEIRGEVFDKKVDLAIDLGELARHLSVWSNLGRRILRPEVIAYLLLV